MVANTQDDLLSAVDDVKYTVRQTRFLKYLSHAADGKRYKLGRLHDHRVAEHDGVGHRPVWHHQREVEGCDRRYDTDRKVLGPALNTLRNLEDLTRSELRHRTGKLGKLYA